MKIAIIGCGAVAANYHIPITLNSKKVKLEYLIDKNLNRAKDLSKKFNISHYSKDYQAIFGKVDCALIALPHHLHYQITSELLKNNINALVEKPLALTAWECKKLIKIAKEKDKILAVGLTRRFYKNYQLVKKIIDTGVLGKINSFTIKEGFVYNWPTLSDFMFKKEKGGGVLYDTGAHTLDTVLWWLGDYKSFKYFDDDMGGVEANCIINLQMKNGTKGTIELSRTRNLINTAIIRGTKAMLTVKMDGSFITLKPNKSDLKLRGYAINNKVNIQNPEVLFMTQLNNFIDSIVKHRKPMISGKEAYKSIKLIEACYKKRRRMNVSWYRPIGLKTSLKDKKVLVTGGTGFIGGHLVESLIREHKAKVCVLVRNFSRLSRIARFPLQIIHGDILDMKVVEKAIRGCEIVFHCAYGSDGRTKYQKEVTIKGTENILKAALKNKVKRFVYMSTIATYGQLSTPMIDENSPQRCSRDVYADSKLKAEKIVFDYYKKCRLPVTIITPTVVYGPYGDYWTVDPLQQLKKYRLMLINKGIGLSNATYVNDVIQALILAATKKKAIGEKFLITAEKSPTWKEFYNFYEKMIGYKSTIDTGIDEVKNFNRFTNTGKRLLRKVADILKRNFFILKEIKEIPEIKILYQKLKNVFPESVLEKLKAYIKSKKFNYLERNLEKPILPITNKQATFFQNQTKVRINKAKKILGYKPQYDLNKGMKLIQFWAKEANLI